MAETYEQRKKYILVEIIYKVTVTLRKKCEMVLEYVCIFVTFDKA
jgi:hypothetical protein